jgi:hypothetical protein
MQQQVDTAAAFLELDELQRYGLVEGLGTVDRNKCRAFLARAAKRGFVPGDGRFATGKAVLEWVGGRFVEKESHGE